MYETHDLIHRRYFSWRINWLHRLWNSDYDFYSKKMPKVRQNLRKKYHLRGRIRLVSPLFKKKIKEQPIKIALKEKTPVKFNEKARILILFQKRIEKTGYIIRKYIKSHHTISEKYEKIKLIKIHPYYMNKQILNVYLISMFIKL
jgi:hypothetical protein